MKFFTIVFTTLLSSTAVQASVDMRLDVRNILAPRADVLNSNLMTFSSNYGGSTPPPISPSGNSARPFSVEGDTFDTLKNAWQRSCGIQKNKCGDFANTAAGRSQGLEVTKCDAQSSECERAVDSAPAQNFATFVSQDANFDYYCEP